jgi:hypothetical protein
LRTRAALAGVAVAGIIATLAIASRRGAPAEPAGSSTFTPVQETAAKPLPSPGSSISSLDAGAIVRDAGALLVVDGKVVGPQVFDTGIHPGDGPLLRIMDKEVLDYIASGKVPAGVTHDAFPKATYRVDITRDGAKGLVTKVMIDVNRNGQWEEVWALTESEVSRKYSLKDDGNYLSFATLRAGRWAPLSH